MKIPSQEQNCATQLNRKGALYACVWVQSKGMNYNRENILIRITKYPNIYDLALWARVWLSTFLACLMLTSISNTKITAAKTN